MSKKKQTFVDPKTGEEMESKWLARWAGWGGMGLFAGVINGLLCGLVGWLSGGSLGLTLGLGMGLGMGVGLGGGSRLRKNIHDSMARYQHRRRYRILKRKQTEEEWANVPDTALSRAQTPGEPQPTGAALSRTDTTDEKDHLTTATEEETTEGVVEVEGTT